MAKTSRWSRWPLPLRVALIFAAAGMTLAVVGIIKGTVPANPLSVFLALLISGGSWGLVSWAVTTAIVDVETDAAEDAPDE
jgi:hypothetical protein